MTTKLNFRSVVFKRAYLIVKETGVSFSAALKQAWERYRQYKAKVAKEIADRINGFDFYYYMSDDSRVYRRWSNIKSEITEQVQIHSFAKTAITAQLSDSTNLQRFI